MLYFENSHQKVTKRKRTTANLTKDQIDETDYWNWFLMQAFHCYFPVCVVYAPYSEVEIRITLVSYEVVFDLRLIVIISVYASQKVLLVKHLPSFY